MNTTEPRCTITTRRLLDAGAERWCNDCYQAADYQLALHARHNSAAANRHLRSELNRYLAAAESALTLPPPADTTAGTLRDWASILTRQAAQADQAGNYEHAEQLHHTAQQLRTTAHTAPTNTPCPNGLPH